MNLLVFILKLFVLVVVGEFMGCRALRNLKLYWQGGDEKHLSSGVNAFMLFAVYIYAIILLWTEVQK